MTHFRTFIAASKKSLLTLLALTVLLSPVSGSAQSSASSFIDYVPDISTFQPVLKPAVQLILDGITLEKSGDKASAEAKFKEALESIEKLRQETNRGYYDALYHLQGVAHEHLGKELDAAKDYKDSLARRESNPVVRFRRGFVLKELGQCEEAIVEFKEVSWRTRANAHEVLYLTAECLNQLGKKEEALRLTEQARMMNTQFLPVIKLLAKTRRELADQETDPQKKASLESQIGEDLNLIRRLDPTDKETSAEFVKYLLKESDPLVNAAKLKQATQIASELAAASDYADDQSVKLLFLTQIKTRDLTAAETTLTKGLKKNPKSKLLLQAQKQLELERGISLNSAASTTAP